MRRLPAYVSCLAFMVPLVAPAQRALCDPPGQEVEDVAQRAESLLAEMTLDEKIGQMTQVDMAALTDRSHVQKYFLGSVLSGGGSDPADNSPQTWADAHDEFQSWALQTRLKIPILYGIDAVHGHNNVDGAVVFPHNIGLGATRNADLVEAASRVTALEVAGTGMDWAFAPCVAVARDLRWGRSYESFGESPEWVGRLGKAAVLGLQGAQRSKDRASVLACAKHFVGDGGTTGGKDQGNAELDEAELRETHLAPYLPAIEAGVGSIMVSYSSWNGQKMHGHKYLLTDVLKGELGFKGFLVSDWAAIDQLPGDYKSDVEASINAGLDMVMIPYGPGQPNNYVEFIDHLKALVAEGKVSDVRIDDAVRRILRIKLTMGLFDRPYTDPAVTARIGTPEHRDIARRCVAQSLVLLKNRDDALPLPKSLDRLHVVGAAANDLGIQCGGWTIDWQGKTGAVTRGGTTILEGIRQTLGDDVEIVHTPDGGDLEGARTILVVLGESPYAEGQGDRADLSLSPDDQALVAKARDTGGTVITLLLSGRPLILGPALEASDAFVAAWLPGTEGQGVANVLFGDADFSGKLPHAWPASMDQVPWNPDQPAGEPLFPFGFGRTYGSP